MLRALASLFSLLARSSGTDPVWIAQANPVDEWPVDDEDGVSLALDDGSLATIALGKVLFREVSGARTAYLSIPTWDAASTYAFAVGTLATVSHDASTGPDADKAATLAALAAAIEADGTLGAFLTADVVGETIRVRGQTPEPFPVGFTASGGSAVVACVADPESFEGMAGFAYTEGRWDPVTSLVTSGGGGSLGSFIERIEVSGVERVAWFGYGFAGPSTDAGSDDPSTTYRTPDVRFGVCRGAA